MTIFVIFIENLNSNFSENNIFNMDLKELKCQYKDCELILENPVTLLCGNTLCRQHLDEFEIKFKCPFCHKQHSVPEDGFFVNESIEQEIERFYQSDPLRKKVKESLIKLNDIIYDYEKIDPECYVFDYIGEIVNRIDLHREELIEEIAKIIEKIIMSLNMKKEEYKSNSTKLEKINLD